MGTYKIRVEELNNFVKCGRDKQGVYMGNRERKYTWMQLINKELKITGAEVIGSRSVVENDVEYIEILYGETVRGFGI